MNIAEEFILYAPRRSGHHAVIASICKASKRPTVFVNDMDPGTSPLSDTKRSQTKLVSRWIPKPRVQKLANQFARFLPIRVNLLHNYEDYSSKHTEPTTNHVNENALHAVVIRDPYNLLASRLKWHLSVHSKFQELKPEDIRDRLHDAIQITTRLLDMALNHNMPIILYDDWLQSDTGPQRYAKLLGTHMPLEWPTEVAKYGPGSSFQGQTGQSAKSLNLFNRWKQYCDDPLFREVALSEQTIKIAELYFPTSTGLAWAREQNH